MKKIILLTLVAFILFDINNSYALSIAYAQYHPGFNMEEDRAARKYACPKAIELNNKLGDKTITYFPRKYGTYPIHCDSTPYTAGEGYEIDPCNWKVGDYTDDGILLYFIVREFVGGRNIEYPEGTKIFVYTDNTDFVTDECFYDDYIYEQTKNFKYTSTTGRTVVVKAYKKTDVKYEDVTMNRTFYQKRN